MPGLSAGVFPFWMGRDPPAGTEWQRPRLVGVGAVSCSPAFSTWASALGTWPAAVLIWPPQEWEVEMSQL